MRRFRVIGPANLAVDSILATAFAVRAEPVAETMPIDSSSGIGGANPWADLIQDS